MYVLTSLHRSTLRAKYKAEDYLSNSYGRKKKVSTTSSHDTDTDTTSPSPPEILDPEIWADPDEEELRKKPKDQTSAVETQDLDNTEHKATFCPVRKRYVVTLWM